MGYFFGLNLLRRCAGVDGVLFWFEFSKECAGVEAVLLILIFLRRGNRGRWGTF